MGYITACYIPVRYPLPGDCLAWKYCTVPVISGWERVPLDSVIGSLQSSGGWVYLYHQLNPGSNPRLIYLQLLCCVTLGQVPQHL